MKKLFYLPTLLLLTSVNHLLSQVNPDSVSQKMDAIFKKYVNTKGPGGSVAVIQDDQVIFKKSYGMVNLEYGQALNANSVFDISSLTKQFTGFAISTLIQEWKISLTDDIRKYPIKSIKKSSSDH
jgi:CubicO group peptidase (beta-lactamase class C family)